MSYHIYHQYLDNLHETVSAQKQFVVAYLSLFDGELKQHIVWAASGHDALLQYLTLDRETYPDLESIWSYCANTDSYASVIEIHNTLTE